MDEKQKNKNRAGFVFVLMAGVFVTLVGVMGFIRSPEITDVVMLVSGLVGVGAGLYRIIVPPNK